MWLDTHARTHALMTRLLAGVTDYLNTEISTSKQKKFSLVTFVDTPGLVDGDMKYPFDVNHSIEWLGKPPSVSSYDVNHSIEWLDKPPSVSYRVCA